MFRIERAENSAVFEVGERRFRVWFVAPDIVRVTCTQGRPFLNRASRIVVGASRQVSVEVAETDALYLLTTSEMGVNVNKMTGALQYLDKKGKVLVQEPERGGKWLTRKTVTRNVFDRDTTVELGQSIDGARATATRYTTVVDRAAFEAKLEFVFSEKEALFGLGSHEEGYANLCGRSRELYQQNMKAVVPHLVSTRGYGVLMDCSSLMTFHDDALGSYWWADCVDELDFYVIVGGDYDGVIQGYRKLTGTPPLPPKWAFGYVQSKERYVTAAEMVEVVAEYRRRQIPLDVIVLDWKSWPNGTGWGQKSLDPVRFPDPVQFTSELHALGAKLMVSVWPIMTGGCENQCELLERGLMLGNKSTYDAFSADARACYWTQAERGLFAQGVDAWWCDCTEPFEADWTGAVKPEPHTRLAMNTGESKLYLDPGEINAYSLAHSQGMYEGQRGATDQKRVLNLTRSSYAGQSRYGTMTWNGDVCATWETLRRSVAEGLNFCATGEPYWTVDAGGFFVGGREDLWFWRGDYNAGTRGLTKMDALEPDPNDTGCSDQGFGELYTRWLQYATFLPMMRSHGTDAAREIWRFGEEGSPFYDAIAATIRLRYRLLPYVYSVAAGITFDGQSMIVALALKFPQDLATHDISDQYMFGPALMVCPVTRPMLFGPGSQPMTNAVDTRPVYLPKSEGWYDFWTGDYLHGGRHVEAGAPLDRIPVFARAGSITVTTRVMQYTDEVPGAPYEICVYTGSDAALTLYEDAGDTYAYEHGECARFAVRWDESHREVTIGSRDGSFAQMVSERDVYVKVYGPKGQQIFKFRYVGDEHRIAVRRDERMY